MTSWRILAVDDEPINLEIIGEHLDGLGYGLEFAESGEVALAMIAASERGFDVILLDRMMPGIDGIEVLRQLKADARYKDTPVILQTAATAAAQVREGIAAGAYYYLTKPYDGHTLRAIVAAAIEDVATARDAARHDEDEARALQLLSLAEFRFSTVAEAHVLAPLLASLAPAPETAVIGLSELLVNAVEHGNLGISYAEKTRLKLDNVWAEEIARRQALPELAGRMVHVAMVRRDGEVHFTITDEGAGFDFGCYLDFDPERAGDPNGRGIALARAMSFSRIEYVGRGNVVVAVLTLK